VITKDIADKIHKIRNLEQEYRRLDREDRNSHDANQAFFDWYNAVLVLFKDFYPEDHPDFHYIRYCDVSGNGYDLIKVYRALSSRYMIMLDDIEKGKAPLQVQESTQQYSQEALPPRVFISHSSKDTAFVEALVDLLEFLGLNKDTMFCSSVAGYGIGLSGRIIDNLLSQFKNYRLFVILVHSPRYYNSPISMNEMGAAWVLKSDFCSILTQDMDYNMMSGVINDDPISIKVNDKSAPYLLNELKDKLINFFNLEVPDQNRWETKRLNFLRLVDSQFKEVSSDKSSELEKEYKRLQLEKLKREADELKKAQIKGNIIKSGKSGRELRIFNAGKSQARNVKVEWLNEENSVLLQNDFSDIGVLTPQNYRAFHMALCMGHHDTMKLRYTWEDDLAENNVYEEDLQL
jgi:hypothetical protein